jgi:serine/threonine protein phosphatase PrpC
VDLKTKVINVSGDACGVCTIKGLKPGNPNWQNQDSFVVSEGVGARGDVHVFGVLDGHGEVGHLVSQRCREQLPVFLAQVGAVLSFFEGGVVVGWEGAR